ncbi:MAG: hypothetical protein A3D26_02660 [Candidatus Blackburnbacteria bacterium RIFCSPHIGHO2_02_FULL_44_20]|uniref:Uncharacterized protein n=1 Tax=Candidatus Blackburnbacteria bacterium RIFCSPHIGHO2_02_FULL_44_20 TaxID=1797516 RepID=A0A1G1V7I5_9BACT|nr:MAG: hypothetical protein A3E16_03465 [Candidatus Blackburnbacteria bacterium RIFCSPHIGHO2_12_FULL_44_25]OGY11380.1 MAG: hypothetical protein A3D26_02660 [Candidatus Blackburnbacteria bacterium RIFCSPHIGHO2_02_FULL_44_20]
MQLVAANSKDAGPLRTFFPSTPVIWAGAKAPTASEDAVLSKVLGDEDHLAIHTPVQLRDLYDLARFCHQHNGGTNDGLVVLPESEIPLKCGLGAMKTSFWFTVNHTTARPDGSFGVAAIYSVEGGDIARIFEASDPMSDEGKLINSSDHWNINGPFGPSQI